MQNIQLDNIYLESSLNEIIQQQQEIIEILNNSFQFLISLIGVIIGMMVIFAFIKGVFRHVGN